MNGKREEKETNNNHVQPSKRNFCDEHCASNLKTEVAQENIESLAKSIPAQKIGSADDFGKVAAFLCSEHANFITGTAIPVAGGTYGGLQ